MGQYTDISLSCNVQQESDAGIDTNFTILIHHASQCIGCINMNVTYKAVFSIKF